MSRQTKLNRGWKKDSKYLHWVGKVPYSDTKARCILCGVKFLFGNVGSMAEGKKHLKSY